MDIDKINLCDATEEELIQLEIGLCYEMDRRKQAKKEKAINNFKKAFENLLQFVDIFYENEETGEFADLRDFDKFKFE